MLRAIALQGSHIAAVAVAAVAVQWAQMPETKETGYFPLNFAPESS